MIARAACDDGSTVDVVAHEALVGGILSLHDEAVVAFLHPPRDAHARVLAARSLGAADS